MNSCQTNLRKWENFADAYENSFEIYSKILYELIVPLIPLHDSCIILDSGCGSGVGIQTLQDSGRNLQIYGNDFSKSMISRARARVLRYPVDLCVADCLHLPYPDTFFDRYLANLTLHAVSDHKKMISEAYRVLKPEGKAVFTYPLFIGNTDILAILHGALRTIKIGPKNHDPSKYLKNIGSLGFESRFFDTNLGMNFSNGKEAAEFIMPLREVAKLKGSEEYHHVLHFVTQKVEECIKIGCSITLGIRIVISTKISLDE